MEPGILILPIYCLFLSLDKILCTRGGFQPYSSFVKEQSYGQSRQNQNCKGRPIFTGD